ncbi:GAF domain-containing sensor histidine kinase [Nodosilinea sp. LEGE 06152]|uniref:GAF domain-containing sensor histidine kinase n=1 Tax=Nodosilinea sp. LEGE 06152 TaxID=2777966 RepID=UPI00187EDB3B|nr:GAF domain-containing sensor histidine kinase [Nodosilinea sp. LEGE 06152]MBE9155896.1 GAF domain-containing sensor histidine kinase [Nodosilinea sp. LEGE 06152]
MGVSVFPVQSEGEAAMGDDQPGEAIVSPGPACPLGLAWGERLQRRSQAIAALQLDQPRSIPAWDEAAQVAARFLGVPLAVVTVANGSAEQIHAAVGLSSLGVGNPLSQHRQLPLSSGLGVYILDSEQPLVVPDTAENPVLAQSELVGTYGIRAYCGVPLMTAQGICLGALAVMDVRPRRFSGQDLGFLAMAARWGMSEYERQSATARAVLAPPGPAGPVGLETIVDRVRLNLLTQLTQELRSPLTTVLGMSTMLSREIYGPLTPKQREYTDIVHRSSQTLMTLVDELIDLNPTEAERAELVPTAVDIEALGQQVVAALTPLAEKHVQTLTLTVEPGETHWILDQRVVKQILYHLMVSMMQGAGDNSTLRVHACRRGQGLALGLWLSNPWLGEGLPTKVVEILHASAAPFAPGKIPRPLLGLLLSQHLAQRHGGQIKVQGSGDSNRLEVLLPMLDAAATRPDASRDAEAGATR